MGVNSCICNAVRPAAHQLIVSKVQVGQLHAATAAAVAMFITAMGICEWSQIL
jgi:hypothetical protein